MKTKEEFKQEALERMQILKLSKQCISAFKHGEVWMSEGPGALYDTEEIKDMLDDFAKEHNGLVYHVIHNYTEFGELYNLLYVSEYDEEWPAEKEDLKDGYVFCYAMNLTDDWCSEFGSIAFKSMFGGVARIS